MTQTPIKLSATARAVLEHAAIRDDRLVRPPILPAGARLQVVGSLLNNGLVEEIAAPISDDAYVWRTGDDGAALMLRVTSAGLAAVAPNGGILASTPTAVEDAMAHPGDTQPTAPARATVRQAAASVLAAWDDATNRDIPALEAPMAALRLALASKPAAMPREGTKQQAVLGLLRREEGATIAQIMEVTSWQSHTVRGFLAGLKKKGTQVEVLERVRRVGPNKEGAKGSYSIYRMGEAG